MRQSELRNGIPRALLCLGIFCASVWAQPKLDSLHVAAPDAEHATSTAVQVSRPPIVHSRKLWGQIGEDFKNVFTTRENLAVMAAGLGTAWGASYFDDQIAMSSFNSELHEGTSLDRFYEAGEALGGAWVQIGGAFGTYGAGKLLSKPGVEALGRDLVRTLVVTQSLTFALKFVVARERPDSSSNRSFPSGHTSGAFGAATVLQRRFGWKVGVPAYAVASYVASSRLNEGRHYLSDVVFGAALGIMVGRTITNDRAKPAFSVSPMFTPHGFGIQLCWFGPRGAQVL